MRYTTGTLSDLTSALNQAIIEFPAPIPLADGTLASVVSQLNLLIDWTGKPVDHATGSLNNAVRVYNNLVDYYTTIILSNRIWNPGTYSVPITPIAVGIRFIKLTFDVTEMTDPALFISAVFEFSYDGGVTWIEPNGVSFQGGLIKMTDLGGNPIVRFPPYVSTHETQVQEPDNPNRLVRGSVVITGASFKTEVTVETR